MTYRTAYVRAMVDRLTETEMRVCLMNIAISLWGETPDPMDTDWDLVDDNGLVMNPDKEWDASTTGDVCEDLAEVGVRI